MDALICGKKAHHQLVQWITPLWNGSKRLLLFPMQQVIYAIICLINIWYWILQQNPVWVQLLLLAFNMITRRERARVTESAKDYTRLWGWTRDFFTRNKCKELKRLYVWFETYRVPKFPRNRPSATNHNVVQNPSWSASYVPKRLAWNGLFWRVSYFLSSTMAEFSPCDRLLKKAYWQSSVLQNTDSSKNSEIDQLGKNISY